jgi:transcriptional regulator with XRE-family HTH domain
MKFSERLKSACAKGGIEWSQTAIGRALGVSKQTADRWMGDGQPSAETLFGVADKLRELGVAYPLSDPRWLATGQAAPNEPADAPRDEMELTARYRNADPRWKLALRLMAALGTEDQVEFATDVNMIIARIAGKKPADIRYAANERVAEAYGPAPHVAARNKERSRK